MQGLGFAIVANIVRLYEHIKGEVTKAPPTRCRACGKDLIFEPRPVIFHEEPAYFCPDANLAFGARNVRGHFVVECDF